MTDIKMIIKVWRERRIERKLKKLEKRYGEIIFLVHSQIAVGRENEYPFGKTMLFTKYALESDRIYREALSAAMRLEGNRYKTAMQLSSAFQEERRKLGLEALLEARRISAEVHNLEGVCFYDAQRPERFADKSDEESDVYIEKLNKLQETVDMLASKHIDSEAMRELIKIKKEDEV